MADERITIKQARKLQKLSQREMAERLGVSRQKYARMEDNADRLTVEEARRICAAIGVEYGEVLYRRVFV